ncbi:MAG: methyltransferase domain-containing protein [Saprospiraceae bacterium]|nr:methyltransferase domain-containing protein [Saprospiraceae bacterium]
MIFERLKSNEEISDTEFDSLYNDDIRETSEIHFTPVEVSIIAAKYLASKNGTKVLDIGSGAGKFCMIGSVCSEGIFVGVELRESFHKAANEISENYQLENVEFVLANINTISFQVYDAFYIFNSFQENISIPDRINDEIPLNRTFYNTYNAHVKVQLNNMPSGTRLATYFSYLTEVPESYKLKSTDFDGKLKLWEKVN